jgi:pilus assembly protein Flp/PilA
MFTNHRSQSRQRGQGLAEYGVVVALVAVITIGAVALFGGSVSAAVNSIGSRITEVTVGNDSSGSDQGDNPTEGDNPSLVASPSVTVAAATVQAGGFPTSGVTISFDANASGGTGDLYYQWTFVNFNHPVVASGTLDVACMNLVGPNAPTWALNVSDSGGLSDYYSGTLDVSAICGVQATPPPYVDTLTASPVVTSVGRAGDGMFGASATVTFDANASGGNGTIYSRWNFADANPNPTIGDGNPYASNSASGAMNIPCAVLAADSTWTLDVQTNGPVLHFSGNIPTVAVCGGNQ